MQHTIGDEFTRAREGMVNLLCENDIEVKAVTTDPDSSVGRAADSLFKYGLYKVKPTHYLHTRHLSGVSGNLIMSPLLANSQVGLLVLRSSNNGPGDYIRSLCEGLGCAIPSGGSVAKSLQLLCSLTVHSAVCTSLGLQVQFDGLLTYGTFEIHVP